MKKLWRILTGRLMVVIPLLLLQLGFFVILFYGSTTYGTAMPVLDILALIIAIYIINRRNDPSYKIGWLLLVLAAPVIGVPLYLITGNRKVPKKLHHGTVRATRSLSDLIKPDESILDDIHDEDAKQIFRYGIRGGGFPVYEHTTSTYFKSGEEWYPVFKKELSSAKHFIFLEYFIINQGWMLDDLVALLEEKVQQGVKVIMIYDDFGALDIPIHFDKQLQKRGIETYRFNKIRPSLAALMNNRDHRKITVVDNRVAFTGGVNISDEYINRHRRFGYWKDSAIMIEGDAVWSFTCMFLGMYTYVRGTN
ncbi:MAG: PLDc N-terminal domain-containing protein, partial [Solobacterium sp.]|nr:PLDc N-terminal domain-containing protein [Solobacterium sp.]